MATLGNTIYNTYKSQCQLLGNLDQCPSSRNRNRTFRAYILSGLDLWATAMQAKYLKEGLLELLKLEKFFWL